VEEEKTPKTTRNISRKSTQKMAKNAANHVAQNAAPNVAKNAAKYTAKKEAPEGATAGVPLEGSSYMHASYGEPIKPPPSAIKRGAEGRLLAVVEEKILALQQEHRVRYLFGLRPSSSSLVHR
jgi:hypothetical protein